MAKYHFNAKGQIVDENGAVQTLDTSPEQFSFDPKAPAADLLNTAKDRFLSGGYQDAYDVLHHLLKRAPTIVSDPTLGPQSN